jgi:hypothetical protein
MMPFSSSCCHSACALRYAVDKILPRGLCHCRCGATNQTGVGREDKTSSNGHGCVAKK